MKNKKGFTLVELLVVIAILAILILVALPNVIRLFKESRMNTFLIETKEVYSTANKTYLKEKLRGNDVNTLSNTGTYKLKLEGKELDYYIRLDEKGNVEYLEVSDSEFCIKTTKKASELNVEDILENGCGTRLIVGNVKYKVKYNANGGTGFISDQEFTYGIEEILTTEIFEREGYIFLGWSRTNDATTATYTSGQKVKNLITDYDEIVTLYAIWNKCPAGYYCESGSTEAKKCPLNTYQENEGSSSCESCPSGYSTEEEGTTSRTKCRKYNSCKTGSSRTCVGGYYDPHNCQRAYTCTKTCYKTTTLTGSTYGECLGKCGVSTHPCSCQKTSPYSCNGTCYANDGPCGNIAYDSCLSTRNTCQGGWDYLK